jgi:hypothetical protein
MRKTVLCVKCGRGFAVDENDFARQTELSLLGCRDCRLKEAGIAECPRECSGCEHFEACPVKIRFLCPVCGEARYTPFRVEAQKALEVVAVAAADGGEEIAPRGCRQCRLKRQLPHMTAETQTAVMDFFLRQDDGVGLSEVISATVQGESAEDSEGPLSLPRNPFGRRIAVAG